MLKPYTSAFGPILRFFFFGGYFCKEPQLCIFKISSLYELTTSKPIKHVKSLADSEST